MNKVDQRFAKVIAFTNYNFGNDEFDHSTKVFEQWQYFRNPNLYWRTPGTVVYASFSQTTLEKIGWSGGSGYSHFGLYVHNVEYKKRDGTTIVGTYLPLLFESLTDPIVSRREELGIPKLFCDINFRRRESEYSAHAG